MNTAPEIRPIGVGLLGLGTVGAGVVEVLRRNGEAIARRAGGPLLIRRVLVRDLHRARAGGIDRELLTTDVQVILDDPQIDVVVELIGGVEPARTWIDAALASGRPVVTANKAVLGRHGRELGATAAHSGVALAWEAAAAAAIPIVRTLRSSLASDRVGSLIGILNGTCNHILTEMTRRGCSMETALREAQEAGYAEADPHSDVSGEDAAYKLVLLAGLAFDSPIDLDAVHVEGIEGVRSEDIAMAAELGMVVKLLAIGRVTNGAVELRVHPAMLPASHPLAAVHGAFNAVFLETDAAGDMMLYGQGAGALPTASAVVSDLVEVAAGLRRGKGSAGVTVAAATLPVRPIAALYSRFYLCFDVADQAGVLGQIATVFGRRNVSVESVIQRGRDEDPVRLVFVSHHCSEADLRAALAEIEQFASVRAIASVIRVLD